MRVLNEDLAKPLREKMYKDQYTDALLGACFQETVDATKVRRVAICAAIELYLWVVCLYCVVWVGILRDLDLSWKPWRYNQGMRIFIPLFNVFRYLCCGML